MAFRTMVVAKPSVHGQMRLAHLYEMPERDVEARVRELEANGLFRRLVESGVVAVEPYLHARFAARRLEGQGLGTAATEGLPQLLDDDGDLAPVIERVGRERFEEHFLRDEALSDADRALLCGITPDEARRLRELVDQLQVRGEFESPTEQPLPTKPFSAVAGIDVEGGRPVLGFFHREIWKGRYRIDEDRREELLRSLPPGEARRVERLLRQLEWIDQRKSTLYRVLEALLEAQAEYLVTQDLDRRRPLTQRALASKLDVPPSILNRLISNKSCRLPWGRETPLKTLVPSSKTLMRDRLYQIATERPELRDEDLRHEMQRLYGARLSRRSVAEYRKELGLGGRGRRGGQENTQ